MRYSPPGPDLSVVIPAVNGPDTLLRALDALAAQSDVRLELLVPERTGDTTRTALQGRYSELTVLPVSPETSIPAMRRLAFEVATAPVVAVIEDHVIVPPKWASTVLAAVSDERPVVGGWVFNAATDRLVDRAAFICEYSHMLTPPASGPSQSLTGNNTGYRRDILERFRSVWEEDRWEDRLHEAMRESGIPLFVDEEIVAAHDMRYRSGFEYSAQRFLYSRAYASMRVAGKSLPARWAYGLAALALPPLLLLRTLRGAWGSAGHRADFIRSLPYQALFVSAWALGEAIGATAGPGGALERVR